jgi:TldD protein
LIRAVSLRLAIFASAACVAAAQSTLLDAMSQELTRNFTVLKQKAEPAPYFLSYEITEQEYKSISGTLGTIDSTGGSKERALDVSVRVGSPKLDNYHSVRGDRGQFTSGLLITYEDSVNSIKRRLWLETDRAYRSAAQRLIRITTNTQVKVAAEDSSDDFSAEPPAVSVQAPVKLEFDAAGWRPARPQAFRAL